MQKWEEFRDEVLKDEGTTKYKVNGNNDAIIFRSSKTYGGDQYIFTDNRCMYMMGWSGITLLFHDLSIDGMMSIYKAIK